MKLYKCNYCDRVFGDRIPHKCNNGFRKHKHSWTEIDDCDNEYQKVEKPFMKEKQIYDILYSLYVDDTDCTQCAFYDSHCWYLSKKCRYNEKFEVTPIIKDFLTKKVEEILEIATK